MKNKLILFSIFFTYISLLNKSSALVKRDKIKNQHPIKKKPLLSNKNIVITGGISGSIATIVIGLIFYGKKSKKTKNELKKDNKKEEESKKFKDNNEDDRIKKKPEESSLEDKLSEKPPASSEKNNNPNQQPNNQRYDGIIPPEGKDSANSQQYNKKNNPIENNNNNLNPEINHQQYDEIILQEEKNKDDTILSINENLLIQNENLLIQLITVKGIKGLLNEYNRYCLIDLLVISEYESLTQKEGEVIKTIINNYREREIQLNEKLPLIALEIIIKSCMIKPKKDDIVKEIQESKKDQSSIAKDQHNFIKHNKINQVTQQLILGIEGQIISSEKNKESLRQGQENIQQELRIIQEKITISKKQMPISKEGLLIKAQEIVNEPLLLEEFWEEELRLRKQLLELILRKQLLVYLDQNNEEILQDNRKNIDDIREMQDNMNKMNDEIQDNIKNISGIQDKINDINNIKESDKSLRKQQENFEAIRETLRQNQEFLMGKLREASISLTEFWKEQLKLLNTLSVETNSGISEYLLKKLQDLNEMQNEMDRMINKIGEPEENFWVYMEKIFETIKKERQQIEDNSI